MNFIYHLRVTLNALIVILVASASVACTSQQIQKLPVTPTYPSIQADIGNRVETLTQETLATYITTTIPLSTPIPTVTYTANISPSKTPFPTPIPTSTLTPFDFHSTTVLSIAREEGRGISPVWQWSEDRHELQYLLEDGGIIFGHPLLSPTGRYLAYVQVVDDLASIWVVDMATGMTNKWSEDLHISFMMLQGYPHYTNMITIQAWNPDETALVFQHWVEQVASDEPIWSYSLFEDGSMQQVGTRIFDISWSPEQPNQMAYLSENGGVFLVDVRQPENSTQVIAELDIHSGSLSWHPDGQHLAIVGNLLHGDAMMWNLDIDAKRLTEIVSGKLADQLVSWSPDGQFLLWTANENIKVFDFKDDSFIELTSFQLPSSMYSTKSPEYPWLSDSNYFSLILPSSNWSGKNLCFFSILGEQVGCLLQTDDISTQTGLDEDTLRLNITWAH